MIDIIIDYVWTNKYLLGVIGLVALHNMWQSWNIRKAKKSLSSLQEWSRELYSYLQER